MWGLGIRESALHWLWPRICLACREDLPFPLAGPLCGACLGRLRRLEGALCARCGAPWPGPEALCPDCRRGLWALDEIRAAFRYRMPLPPLLYAFKYGGRLWAGRALADWMAGAFPGRGEFGATDALVPVPLHPARERRRGFNQARILAQAVGRAGGLPVIDALRRRWNTRPQSRLARSERRGRLEGAFVPAPGSDVRGLRLLLIDDVCTSGATLEACAKALRAAGAESVKAYALARG